MKSFKNSKKTSKKNLKVRKLRSKKLVRKNKRSSMKYVGGTPPPGGSNNGMMTVTRAMKQEGVLQRRPPAASAAPSVQQSQRKPPLPLPQNPVYMPMTTPSAASVVPAVKQSQRKPLPPLPVEEKLYANLGLVLPVEPGQPPRPTKAKPVNIEPVYMEMKGQPVYTTLKGVLPVVRRNTKPRHNEPESIYAVMSHQAPKVPSRNSRKLLKP